MSELLTVSATAKRMGMTNAAVSHYAARPGAPVLLEDGKRRVRWPEFVRWWGDERERVAREQSAPADLDEARARKEAALAEQEEHKLAIMRGTLMTLETHQRVLGERVARLNARLSAFPARLVPLAAAKAPEGATALRSAFEDAVEELKAELAAPVEAEAA